MNLIKILFFCFLASGCSTSIVQKNNILAIDKHGNTSVPGSCSFFGMGCETMSEPMEREYINTLIEQAAKTKKVVIYIHGGLNTPQSGIDKAHELSTHIIKDGYFPIFIDWRSGLATSYFEHLFFDRQGEYWPIAGPLTFPFILVSDIGRGFSRAPMVMLQNFNNYARAVRMHSKSPSPSEYNAYYMNQKLNGINKEFGELPDNLGILGEWKATEISLSTIETPLSMATAPIFDAFGTSSWGTMKRRTEILFNKDKPESEVFDNEIIKNCQNDTIECYSKLRKGAATKFFNALYEKQRALKENNEELEIILIGHSMGTIVSNKIISRWPNLDITKIVYMAAATSIEDFNQSVIPYLNQKEHQNTKFYNYTLHPIAENTESHLFGIGQTGSLLTQIDNFYETPTTEEQRTLGRWSNIMNGINYFQAINENTKKRIYFRTMPLDCLHPTMHGEFDDDKFISANHSFWQGSLGDKAERSDTSTTCKSAIGP